MHGGGFAGTIQVFVENSFVGSLLFQQEEQTADYYRQLLDIEEKQGYVMVIQFGQSGQFLNRLWKLGQLS